MSHATIVEESSLKPQLQTKWHKIWFVIKLEATKEVISSIIHRQRHNCKRKDTNYVSILVHHQSQNSKIRWFTYNFAHTFVMMNDVSHGAIARSFKPSWWKLWHMVTRSSWWIMCLTVRIARIFKSAWWKSWHMFLPLSWWIWSYWLNSFILSLR